MNVTVEKTVMATNNSGLNSTYLLTSEVNCPTNMKLGHDLKLVKGALFTIVFP